jgi:hypothetical protein
MRQKKSPLHIAARKYAEILMEAVCCVYSQHIKGIHNNMADALSREFDFTDEDLTKFILSNFSFSGTEFVTNISDSARNILLGDLLAAEVQRDNGVTKNTRDKEARVWRRWLEYTKLIEFEHDIWLESLSPENRARFMGAFAAVLQRRQFSRPDEKDLAAGTVQKTVAKLGEIFMANVGYNTTHGMGTHGFQPSLLQQFKGMRNEDPMEVQQKALPVSIYRELHWVAQLLPPEISHLDCTIAWLQTLAFFWCMRSCEYSDVQGECRTKILCVRNFRFFNTQNIYHIRVPKEGYSK